MENTLFHSFSFRIIGLAAVMGFALLSCSKDTDECANVKCENGGTCAGGDCACTVEWQGKTCNTLNLKGVICGNATRVWKLASVTEAATGKVLPLDAEDKTQRLTVSASGTWNITWQDTSQNKKADWIIENGKLYLYDKANPVEKLELRSIKWVNNIFTYRLDNDYWGEPNLKGDIEFNYIQAN